MPEVLYGTGAYRRDTGAFPEFRLVNMVVEKTRGAQSGISLLDRPGLISAATAGVGPIRKVYRRPGLFNGDFFSVSGGGFYRGSTLIGSIPGDGPVIIASSDTEIVVTCGKAAYSYDGTDFVEIDADGDGSDVSSVAFIGGLFIFGIANSNKWTWSAVNDARTVDPADFANAETAPDILLDVIAVGDNLYLMGAETIEVWYLTGDLFLPFTRITQRTALKGVFGTGCSVVIDNAVHFIGADAMTYRMAEVPERLSDHGIEERVAAANDATAFGFTHEGHSTFAIRLDIGTWGLDLATGEWSELASFGAETWAVTSATMDGANPVFGSATTNDLLRFGGTDDLGSPIAREFTAAIPAATSFVLHTLELEINPGAIEEMGEDPVIEMRASRDGGRTWGAWRPARMGRTGRYRARPRWRRLGVFDAPGALLHFRCTAAVRLRMSSVIVNERAASRSRAA